MWSVFRSQIAVGGGTHIGIYRLRMFVLTSICDLFFVGFATHLFIRFLWFFILFHVRLASLQISLRRQSTRPRMSPAHARIHHTHLWLCE